MDTGAALTCIHALDAIRIFGMTPSELDPSTWTNPMSVGGIGGGLLYREEPAQYAFPNTDGTFEFIDGTVLIGELRSQATPALLGWDLLKHFDLHCHGGNQTITLERI